MPYFDVHGAKFTTLNGIRTPRVARAIGFSLVLFIAGIILFLALVPWVQTASGPGKITALNPNDRLQEINALVSGRIEQWYVRDGSRVKVGDPIVRIVDNDPQLLERLRSERQQVVANLSAAETALEIAEIDRRRMEELFEQGLAARREFEQARIRVEELRSRVAQAAAEVSRVDVKLSRQSVQIVRAPRDGTILRVNAGDTATFVSMGQVVATFVPDNVERALELYIDGRDVAIVRVGAPVRIQFEGWPVIQISGWPSKAVGTFAGRVVAIDASAEANGRFRILVEEDKNWKDPWPAASFVRFGSKARGWVLLDTVPVGFEIWRQLNNFPPNFPTGGQSPAGGGA
ncbi:efflux RND transporter periplasmic adaptor subunit [Pseudohaliea rubra]|uniref:RND efflux membrane fusion protein n=1 Tax=Pseudohaliea rubra DSM 19751 TaxID=1265313 RepID=A0A095WZ86_9GAMM|nr:HlyD family efflux transporter periplasmic adaptor subunit [Pseudohaliea rubra]KGE03954.1 RND efflux membrane fusion protein [Pseudohaliea rubra DSM 19751]